MQKILTREAQASRGHPLYSRCEYLSFRKTDKHCAAHHGLVMSTVRSDLPAGEKYLKPLYLAHPRESWSKFCSKDIWLFLKAFSCSRDRQQDHCASDSHERAASGIGGAVGSGPTRVSKRTSSFVTIFCSSCRSWYQAT